MSGRVRLDQSAADAHGLVNPQQSLLSLSEVAKSVRQVHQRDHQIRAMRGGVGASDLTLDRDSLLNWCERFLQPAQFRQDV